MRVCPYCHLLFDDSHAVCPQDGTQTAAAAVPPLPPALQPKFTDLQAFARGQTGTLQLATQNSSGKRGLLKVMPLDGFEGSERVRLKRELRKQTKLAHDGLPRIVDGGDLDRELWLVREFVAGESLAQRIRRLGKLDVQQALLITAQVASALDELQRNGLLHRDVKPGHVILQNGPKGMPISKLIDAGVAARLSSGTVFDLIGTPAYISPEQVAGKLISFRSDLYALGCMLFEMLTGAPPFAADDVKAVLEAHKSAAPPELPAEIELPAGAQALLRALLLKEPRQRPFSAQQVRRTIEPLLPPGAPLPVLQSRAPSSAGGISAPPPAGSPRNGARPRAQAKAAPPVPAAGRGAPKPASGRAQFGRGELTEDIDLEEIELAPDEPGPRTINLVPDDIEELDAEAFARAPNTINLGPDDLEALEVREQAAALAAPGASDETSAQDTAPLPAAAVAAAAEVDAKRESVPEPEHSAPAADAAPAGPEPAVAEPAAQAAAVVDATPASEPAAPSEAAGASSAASSQGRRAVDFDVESLFEDEVPEPRVTAKPSLTDAAPTQIYRPESAPAQAASAVAARKKAEAEAVADPEGTVVVARPGARSSARLPWRWIGAAAVVVVVLVVALSGGGEDEQATSAPGQGAEGSAQQAGAAEHEQGETGASSNSGAAGPAAAARPKDENAAGDSNAEPAGQAQAEAIAAAETDPEQDPEGEAEPEGELAAQDERPQAEEQPPAEARAAGDSADDSRATLSASAASAKLGPSAGSKLAAPRASRAERVAKAAELKDQGRAHYRAGRYREAAAAYQGATEQDPSDPGAFAGLAASRLASGNANAAIAAYSRAVRLQPTSSGFHAALGRAYLANNDRGRARAAYEKALELNPENGAAKTALAQLD